METLFDRLAPNPEVDNAVDEWYRRLTVESLAVGREYRKAGLKPELLPAPDMTVPPEDSKAVARKKDRLERRVSRLMRNPACRRRLWGDIIDLPTEQLLRIEREENAEWMEVRRP